MSAPSDLSILVGEDDPRLSRLITISLSSSGWQVTCVETSQFIAGGDAAGYDVLLCDVPYVDSAVLPQLAKTAGSYGAPLVLLTDADRESDLLELMSTGCFDILQKPFMPSDLEDSVGLACGTVELPATSPGSARNIFERIGPPSATPGAERLSLSEWRLLEVLASRIGEPVLYQELLGRVWGPVFRNYRAFLDAWMARLAAKVRLDSYLGLGYVLREPGRL